MDYESDVRINPDALDIEWLDQPGLVFKYSKNLAFWKKRTEKLKQKIDLVKANLDKKIRTFPDEFNVGKLTETVVFNTIMQQKEYKVIYNEYLEARYEQNIAQAAVDAIDHKKSALENLVRLYGQQYFAGPKVPRDIGSEWEKEQKEKRANRKVAEKMKRNVK